MTGHMTGPKKQAREALYKVEGILQPKAKLVKQSLCSCGFLLLALQTIGLILFYYVFSIGLTFYNQRFIKKFSYPMSLTMAHFVIKFILAAVIRSLLEWRKGEPRIMLPWPMYIKKLAPTGLTASVDIGLSNWSFEFITVSLYTMTKSVAILFLLFFAIIMKLEKMRVGLIFVVLFIAGGLFMFTFHSTQFNLEGFILCLTASALSGLRWNLAQIVTQKKEIGLSHPLDLMYHVQPWMIVGLLPLAVAFEAVPLATTENFFRFHDTKVLLTNLGLVVLGASLAFFLEFSEFLLVSRTSSLTLSISGIFKEICTLFIAFEFNHDQIKFLNGLGLVVCIIGIIIHVVMKAVNRGEDDAVNDNDGDETEMLMLNGEANTEGEESEDDVFNVRTDR
ncbi:unnamed protein product [Owenia fusiformis]|uniref:Uncharacterized protein n=1 Tax=Owenia fusiformis TaxID=6347 RepID=A0A8J1UVH9_OWEFU|nr:unnamed protein product [Owenia fusiformis]